MARHQIQNEVLAIEVDELGAELSSKKYDGAEYLWQGEADTWNGRAPILFPIIGPLLGGSYSHAGKTYQMGQHGFARHSQWTLIQHDSDFLLFRLESSPESLKQYPFHFRLEAGYRIRGNELECSYSVLHCDSHPKSEPQSTHEEIPAAMPFAIGSHTAFQIPIAFSDSALGLQFSDYELEFEREEDTLRYLQTSEGPLSGKTVPFRTENRKLALEHSFFAGGSIVFKDLASERITIQSKKNARKASIQFAGFPYLTLWTYQPASRPYLCIEPWQGITATLGSSKELSEREGNRFLKPGEEFYCSFQICLE